MSQASSSRRWHRSRPWPSPTSTKPSRRRSLRAAAERGSCARVTCGRRGLGSVSTCRIRGLVRYTGAPMSAAGSTSRTSAGTRARGHPQGLALQQALERQAALPAGARRHRHPAVRGVQEGRAGGAVRARRPPAAGVVADRHRHGAQGRARAARLRARRHATSQVVHEAAEYPITPKEHGVAFLLDHRHLWLRSARQHAILRIRSEVDPRLPRVLRRARLRAVRRADPHARPRARARRRCSRRLLRRDGLPDAERPALRSRPARWPSARCTASARPSAPRSRRRAAT